MKIFLDTANLEEIKKAQEWLSVDGITTNPTLLAREKKPAKELLKEIASIVSGPVSAEVISLDTDGMINEALALAGIAQNIVVKVPLTKAGLAAVKILYTKKIKSNMTLCFSASQALLAAKAGADFVSPFIGRLDDISAPGMELIKQIKTIYQNYGFKTQVIVASVRHPLHVLEAALIGADIATVPFLVLEQLVKHPLTDTGIQKFLEDYQKIPK